ncbi:MAG TPA: MmcQ/YjbR family DNA-binding protein [Acidimicrobiales bacterium]|jgi:hypothetical protein|nr:MmcQ/YjbR family DNA-binding protein [Acidimicrobiales bacterium]
MTVHVRGICMALPHVVERVSHGEAAWFIDGGKNFAVMSDHHHDDRLAVHFAAEPGVQDSLIASDPARFFRPPYVGGRGWVGAYLDLAGSKRSPSWDLLAQLIRDAWLHVAPARLRSDL